MDLTKIGNILNMVAKIIAIIASFLGKKNTTSDNVVDIKQDEQTNKETLKKVNDVIKSKIILAFACSLFISGCLNFNFGQDNSKNNDTADKQKNKSVLLANPLNVYRNSTNIVIKALIQNKKGKWVESKENVLIPSGWYIVSGVGLED